MKRCLAAILIAIVMLSTGCSAGKPANLRVMTYNIHIAKGMDSRLDIERTARVIREARPDLVALQEVDRRAKRSERIDEPARLAELTDMAVVFAKNLNLDLSGGEYGIAVLSRLPITSHQHYLLPRFGNNEQRGVLEVHVELNGRPLVFFATHLDHQKDDAERIASVAMIRDLVARQAGLPVILAGDFNAAPDSRAIADTTAFLDLPCPDTARTLLTFPASQPDKRIDYIFYRPDAGLRPLNCRVIPEPLASDHRPVVADFEFITR